MATRLSARTRALIERSDLELTLPAFADAGGWRGVFASRTPGADTAPALELEIGIGKDPHIVERACAHPGRCFVGIEHSRKKLDKVHAKALRRGTRNLRLVRADAFRVLDPLFPDASLEAAYLLFPDPWPKKRHHKKRLVQPSLIDVLARKLRPGSPLELRTDHAGYRDQIVDVLRSHAAFRDQLDGAGFTTSPRDGHIPTLFETKFRHRGLEIYHVYFERVPLPDEPAPRPPYPLEFVRTLDPIQGADGEETLIEQRRYETD